MIGLKNMPELPAAIYIGRSSTQAGERNVFDDVSAIYQEVRILQISLSDCLVECPIGLSTGEVVSIVIARIGRRGARVSNVDGCRYECVFDRPITAADLRAAAASETPEDVSAVRRHIRDTVARSAVENQIATGGLGSRIRAGLGKAIFLGRK